MPVRSRSATTQSSQANNASVAGAIHLAGFDIKLNPHLDSPLSQVLDSLRHMVEYCVATVQLEDRGVLQTVAQRGFELPEGTPLRQPIVEDELYQAIVQDEQFLIVPDIEKDSRKLQRPDLDCIRAWMGAPIIIGDRVSGLITVGHDQPHAYSANDAQILVAFANQVVTIIEQVRLSQRLAKLDRLYQTLHEVVVLVNSTLDPEQVLDEILKQVERIVPYDSASVHLLYANRLSYASGRGFPTDSHPDTELNAGENAIFQEIRQSQKTMVIDDVRQHPDWHTKPGLEYIRSWIGAPLVAKGRVIGYLTLDHSQAGAYTREDAQIADTFARQVAAAIENAQLYTETRRRAEEQAALNTVATAASRSLNLSKMLNYVLDAVQELFDADRVEVRLLAETGKELRVSVQREDATLPDVTSQANLPDPGITSYDQRMAAVPLRSKEQLLGSLTVVSREHLELAPEQVSLLEAIGYQLSLAVENARLYEQLKESEARKTSLLRELEKSLRELQEAQTKLVQSEKLAAIGQLVSGIAHELNNPLTSIIGYAQLLRSADVDSEVRSDLNRIVEQAQRSARIVQNLLTFSRQYKPERRLVDVNQLIQDTLELVNYQLTVNQVTVEQQLSESVPAIMADPHQLQQVWLNLIQNAYQAMSDTSRPSVLRIHSFVTDANQVRVEFSDNGPGIAPDALEKLFDPFFTTKPVGKGTGLGLSICYGIVQEHSGQIMAENNAEGGATFVVELPIQEADAYAQQVAESPLKIAPGHGKVLLVDDEPAILELVDRFLSRQGYEVETVDDGNQAAEQIINQDYDVIVLDMVMPQKGGIEICQQIVKERPEYEARIIFASGDLITDEVRAFLKESKSRYIAKPFELSELIQVIQEVTGQLG